MKTIKIMEYSAKVLWEQNAEKSFTSNKYSRRHWWLFDGGEKIKASSSPQVVPVPMSDESAVDPEEAFIAVLSSCHMLFFLSIAAQKGYIIERYEDNPEGLMAKDDNGKMAMKSVTLRPEATFSAKAALPDFDEISALHHQAHSRCFLANSVKTKIEILIK